MDGAALLVGEKGLPPVDWTISDLIEDAARRAPDAVAAKQFDAHGHLARAISYAELVDASRRIAHVLGQRFTPGERIGLWGVNSIGWLVYELAVSRLGALLVTLDPGLGEHELRFMLQTSGAAGVIMDRSHRGRNLGTLLGALRPELPKLRETLFIDEWPDLVARAEGRIERSSAAPDDPALIVFTSGTTGRPKGVMMHHYGLVNNARMTAFRTGLPEGSVMLNPLPAYSIGGAATVNLGAISRINPQIIIDHFDAAQVLRLIEQERIAWMPLVPAMLIPMVEHSSFASTDITSLEAVWMGGTIITPEMVRLARAKLGVRVQMIYGQTEAGGVLAISGRDDGPETVARTVGHPLDHSTIRIASLETGDTNPRNVIGEIRLSSPFMTRGYFENADATATLFDAGGFMRTGDLGLVDDDGNLRITGRLKEMIIRGGKNIYPREIEDVIGDFPGVAEVAVIGVPHDRWGEEVAVALKGVAGTQIDLHAARSFVHSRIAAYKVPKLWRQVEDFPRSAQGKIRKVDLIELFTGTGAL